MSHIAPEKVLNFLVESSKSVLRSVNYLRLVLRASSETRLIVIVTNITCCFAVSFSCFVPDRCVSD